jgi:hypothetical protein
MELLKIVSYEPEHEHEVTMAAAVWQSEGVAQSLLKVAAVEWQRESCASYSPQNLPRCSPQTGRHEGTK